MRALLALLPSLLALRVASSATAAFSPHPLLGPTAATRRCNLSVRRQWSPRFTIPPATTTTTTSLNAGPANHHHAAGNGILRTTFAGKIWPTLRKLHIGPETGRNIVKEVLAHTQWQDIAVLLVVAYLTLPMAHIFKRAKVAMVDGESETGEQSAAAIEAARDEDNRKRTKLARLFQPFREQDRISKLISGIAKVTLSVYLVEVWCVALRAAGFKFPALWNLPVVYSKVAYSTWALRRFLELKRMALCKVYNVETTKMGRVEILDRFLSGFSVAMVGLLLFDWLSVKMGMALKGLFAFGSVGTLAFTFASQDLVSQFVSGLFLSASNKVYAGDDVAFGDGTKGKVMKLGWMETVMRESDNTITAIPNSKLANQKISNYSRVRMSQVTQTLRFHYEDADKMPALLESIKKEIQKSCPKLITDGSRPFRVFWTSFNEDHLEVVVNTHFYIPPGGYVYLCVSVICARRLERARVSCCLV